jgi:hypothetical protein
VVIKELLAMEALDGVGSEAYFFFFFFCFRCVQELLLPMRSRITASDAFICMYCVCMYDLFKNYPFCDAARVSGMSALGSGLAMAMAGHEIVHVPARIVVQRVSHRLIHTDIVAAAADDVVVEVICEAMEVEHLLTTTASS